VFGLLDSNNLRNKEIPEQKTHREGFKGDMTANSNTHGRTTNTTTARSESAKRSRSDSATVRKGLNGSAAYARQTAERSVDVPVGVALTVADRVNEIVEPFTARQTAERELRSIRTRVERELNRFERRGAGARRKARTRVRQTRNRVERELRQRRRKVETTVKQRRAKAEDGLKRAQTVVQDRVTTLV
jgi:hypothetical protein